MHFFGIRHHGPGSAKSVLRALQQLQPDVLVIEGVEETDALLPHLANPQDFTLPVAMLIYNPKNFRQAVYYPFTEFSPEWNAMIYAQQNNIPIVNMDLPQTLRFGIEEKALESQNTQNQAPTPTKKEYTEEELALLQVQRDPIGYLASLAGYEDGERWWEIMFEQKTGDLDTFAAITEMMQALRQEFPNEEEENTLREAYMRETLRKVQKDGYQRIAVVCGAYHVPALDIDKTKAKDDKALLKGLPKVKTQATWIPWTYQRIANSSGYGAGVISPAWYSFLFDNADNATIQWMVKVATLLREEDMDTSSAHIIEGVRLAETLATMRGLAIPTLQELTEAIVSVLLNGNAEQLDFIHKKLIIGEKLGAVPKYIPAVPLQQDIDDQTKQLKLTKYLTEKTWIKQSSTAPKGGLDLREEHDRKQSQFLHRLNLLNISWGREEAASGRETSTKNEYWRMEWKPEYALLIIEASVWGNTLELAATQFTVFQATTANLAQLSKLLSQVIKANLPESIATILHYLQETAALSKDVQHLMQTLPNLATVVRYGDVRQTDVSMVNALIKDFIPRISILLPNACVAINEDLAKKLVIDILGTHRALQLLATPEFTKTWNETLTQISESSATQPYIQGVVTRLLFDAQLLDIEPTSDKMSYALSKGNAVMQAANWLEGFLFNSGLLLIYNPALWGILDKWVDGLNDDNFVELLPVLRRTFSKFAKPEREKMLLLAKQGTISLTKNAHTTLHTERVQNIVPTLKLLLGL